MQPVYVHNKVRFFSSSAYFGRYSIIIIILQFEYMTHPIIIIVEP